MVRILYFQIKDHLRVGIDSDVPENERITDTIFKVDPLISRIEKGYESLPRRRDIAVEE